MEYWQIILISVITLLVLIIIAYWARFFYAVYYGRKRVYLKVLVPRVEVKKHKEEEIEKDFREYIGKMEQLIRSLHEMRELDLANRVHTMIWNYDNTVFEILCKYCRWQTCNAVLSSIRAYPLAVYHHPSLE